jgi:hypothetical protein
MLIIILAILFSGLSLFVAVFQWLLFFKMPWGEYTMGGIHKGVLPKPYRIAALIQSLLILFNALVVLNHSELMTFLPIRFTTIWMWVIMVMMGLSSFMNLITQSQKERRLWAPITLIVFISSVLIYIL